MDANIFTALSLFYCGFKLLDVPTSNAKPTSSSSIYQPEVMSQEYETFQRIYGPGPNLYEEGDLFEGDIAGINPTEKNVIVDQSKKWTPTTIPYMIDIGKFGASDIQVITTAFHEFAQHTCIRFEPLITFNKRDFLFITALKGCWSYVGRRGGAQTISLQNPGCVHRGIVVHELMHALGVWHEQSRHDRDDHVTINWDNIAAKNQHNFQKRTLAESQTFNLNYDYGSVMHYSAYSFALNRTVPTIVPKQNGAVLGQRDGLSPMDCAKINRFYECPTTSQTTSGLSIGDLL